MTNLNLKVTRNMFLMFQQFRPCFARVPPMFRNMHRTTGTRPIRSGNTPNKPLTSRNAKNMFPAYCTATKPHPNQYIRKD